MGKGEIAIFIGIPLAQSFKACLEALCLTSVAFFASFSWSIRQSQSEGEVYRINQVLNINSSLPDCVSPSESPSFGYQYAHAYNTEFEQAHSSLCNVFSGSRHENPRESATILTHRMHCLCDPTGRTSANGSSHKPGMPGGRGRRIVHASFWHGGNVYHSHNCPIRRTGFGKLGIFLGQDRSRLAGKCTVRIATYPSGIVKFCFGYLVFVCNPRGCKFLICAICTPPIAGPV